MPLAPAQRRLTKEIVLANIPAFPPMVLRVLDLLASDHPDMVAVVREISNDATLSAQVLRVANSPLFGLTAQVDTVHRAVITLGFVHIQSLVMAVAASNYMKGALKSEALEKCWRHTLASAVLCRELAQAAALPPDRAYTYGLLHDIGRLGLLVAYPAEYAAVLCAADRDAISLLDAEKRRFSMDHCEVGRSLVEQWKLPPEFCVVAGRHHDPPSGAPLDALTVTHQACRLADTLGYAVVPPLTEVPYEEILSQLPPAARNHFPEHPGILQDMLAAMINQDVLTAEPAPDLPPSIRRVVSSVPLSPRADSPVSPPAGPTFAAPEVRPLVWDPSVLLLVAMVLLALIAGACCLGSL